MASIIFVVSLFILSAQISLGGRIHPNLIKKFKSEPKINIFIELKNSNLTQAFIESVDTTLYDTIPKRALHISTHLKEHTNDAQKHLKTFLNKQDAEYVSFWISNEIFVKNADKNLVKNLANLEGISLIREEIVLPILRTEISQNPREDCTQTPNPQWGIKKIGADRSWSISKGDGVLVGVIDTGARVSHLAIKSKYVGTANSGWYDPLNGRKEPFDDDKHGSHVTGTILGDYGVGVAPNAKFSACRACGKTEGCPEHALKGCGQWMACPDKGSCKRVPAVINNSWGGGMGSGRSRSKHFDSIIDSWLKIGIVPVFANGNSGQKGCSTVLYPASNTKVLAVGGTHIKDGIYYDTQYTGGSGSSYGPNLDGEIRPDICAPGQWILSAGIDSDQALTCLLGTSMASPHVAGAVALLLSKNPNMTFEQVKQKLYATVNKNLVSPKKSCGSISETTFPNNAFGRGQIDIYKALTS